MDKFQRRQIVVMAFHYLQPGFSTGVLDLMVKPWKVIVALISKQAEAFL
jgi:hypothetical protein